MARTSVIQKTYVRDVSPVVGAPEGTIIGLEGADGCWEVVKRESGAGEWMDFTDANGKVCRLYVREFGKLPHGIIEHRRW